MLFKKFQTMLQKNIHYNNEKKLIFYYFNNVKFTKKNNKRF